MAGKIPGRSGKGKALSRNLLKSLTFYILWDVKSRRSIMAKCTKNPASSCSGPAACSKKHVELQITPMHHGTGDVQEAFCVSHWTPEQFSELREFLERKRTGLVIRSFSARCAQMKPHLKAIALLWSLGYELSGFFPRRTYYHVKKQLLSHGIDITSGGQNVTL